METKPKDIEISLHPGKYVVAVSGGLDSVALLNLLVQKPKIELIVAHFDHGIRPDSDKDREFVEDLARNYSLPFEYQEGHLGIGASEETARDARYDFFDKVKDKHQAKAIVTAHHQDDLIETAIINMIRGTNRQGLSSLKTTKDLIRPLIDYSRKDIERYVKDNDLRWREDPTNLDTRYLRNYVRLSVIPALTRQDPKWRARLLNKINKSGQINQQINSAISYLAEQNLKINDGNVSIPRNWLIMLPNAVGLEVIKHCIDLLETDVEINQRLLKSTLLFSKTAKPGKQRPISKTVQIFVKQRSVLLLARQPD